ncbi:MAG TPA: hypothetical protein DEG32_11375 [Balneolaceae bacterium]|nr:hypothetical protein [Balneolaceae bacterium]
MKLILFTGAAREDYQEAKKWYSEIDQHLGEHFESSIDHALRRVLENPVQFPIVSGDTRQALVRRFPFSVFYIIDEFNIVITAILHHRRNPKHQNR